jgi:hypothetical protein
MACSGARIRILLKRVAYVNRNAGRGLSGWSRNDGLNYGKSSLKGSLAPLMRAARKGRRIR